MILGDGSYQMQPKRRVLIVDDDPDIRLIVTANLDQLGCVVGEAADGLEALERLQDFRPEVMILDVNMPFLDGFGVLTRVRELGLGKHVHTLMLTSREDKEDVQRSIALGASDYLLKPFSAKQLVLKVARSLSRSKVPLDH